MIPKYCQPTIMILSKPRASGDDPRPPVVSQTAPEVNPARAGMILLPAFGRAKSEGKPRASGDDPNGLRKLVNGMM